MDVCAMCSVRDNDFSGCQGDSQLMHELWGVPRISRLQGADWLDLNSDMEHRSLAIVERKHGSFSSSMAKIGSA